MAGTHPLKVYTATGQYVASCLYAEDAGTIVTTYGKGATIRYGHAKKFSVWTEGKESKGAGESCDFLAATVNARVAAINGASREKYEKWKAAVVAATKG